MSRSMRILSAAVLAMVLMGASAGAQQGRPLPSFTATTAAGAAVASDHLNVSERWLLVYAAPGAVACDRLLRALDSWAAGEAARVVVIAAGPRESIETGIRPLLPTSAPELAVYADPDGSVAGALGVTSVPALVAVEGGAIAWIVQGVLNDPAMVEPVVRGWLAQR